MTQLADEFANAMVNGRMDEIAALPEDQRKPVLVQLIIKAKQKAAENPAFNQEGLPVSDTTQQQLKKYSAVASGEWQGRGATAYSKSRSEELQRQSDLESMGVVTDRDLPKGKQLRLGFGANKIDDLSAVLSDQFGVKVPVIQHGEDVLYYDPTDKKVVKANFGVLASMGHGIPMAADVAGTYLVGGTSPQGAVAKTVAKETLGSGVFTTGGEMLRLAIGKFAGVHDMDWDEMGKQSALVGGEAAAFTGGIGGLVASGKGLMNMFEGGIISPKVLEQYGLPAQEANQVIDEVNAVLKETGSKKRVKLTAAQKSDDAVLESYEQEISKSQEHGQRFREFKKEQADSMTEAVKGITKPDVARPGVPDAPTVGDLASRKVAQRTAKGREVVARNQAELQSQLDAMGQIQRAQVGEPTADYLKLKTDASEQAQQNAWGEVKRMGNYNEASDTYGIEIPVGDETKRLRTQFARRTDTAKTKIAASGTGAVYKQPVKGKAEKPQDLSDLNREISDLKEQLANMRSGKQYGTTSQRDLNKVIKSLEADRRFSLVKAGRGDLMKEIELAETMTADFHKTYKRSVIGDLLAVNDNGVPLIKQKNFVDDMLRRDTEELNQFTDVIGDNPDLVQKWREGISDAWQTKAFNEQGRYSPQLSKRWIKNNKDVLEYFFTNQQIQQFSKTGRLAEAVAKQTKQLDTFVKKANTKYGTGALSGKDPEAVTKFITQEGGSWARPSGEGVERRISKIKFVKNMYSEHPLAWKSVQNDYKQWLRNETLDPKTGGLNHTKISRLVGDSENERAIKEVLGTKFFDNMKSIKKLTDILNKKENRLVKSQAVKATLQAVRAGVAPPLTARGRAMTAAITFYNKEAQSRVADALLDDDMMREVAGLIEHSANTRRFYEKAFSLGFMLPNDNEIPED